MNDNPNLTTSASQNRQIENYLRQGGKLTSLDAFRLFNCMRLANRIHDLREQGVNIHTEKVKTPTGKIVTRYSLKA